MMSFNRSTTGRTAGCNAVSASHMRAINLLRELTPHCQLLHNEFRRHTVRPSGQTCLAVIERLVEFVEADPQDLQLAIHAVGFSVEDLAASQLTPVLCRMFADRLRGLPC